MQIALPESVHRYCTEGRVQSAVDLLLSSKAPKMPDGLQWDEVEDFYRACLAAQQTKVEWAIALNALWKAVFADQVVGWRSSSIRQLSDNGTRLDVEQLWTDNEFTRDFTRGDYCLEPQIELDPDEGVRANVSLWKDGDMIELRLPTGAIDVDRWLCSAWVPLGETGELDLASIRDQAKAAIEIANAIVGSAN